MFEEDVSTVDGHYSECRRCMCDLFALRALARNESASENRKTMVGNARKVSDQLQGTVSLEVDMLMRQYAPRLTPPSSDRPSTASASASSAVSVTASLATHGDGGLFS